MNLDSLKETFLLECEELLENMEKYLLTLEKTPDDSESVHALFRAVHTIKGSAGMFGYQNIVSFTHHVETMLDSLRQGKVAINSDIIAALLSAHDHINLLVDIDTGRKEGAVMNEKVAALGEDILQRLRGYFTKDTNTPSIRDSGQVVAVGKTSTPSNTAGIWHISLRFKPEVLKDGLDPYSFILYLKKIGELLSVYTVTDGLGDLNNTDPELFNLGFEIELQSAACREDILSVFEFLESDADIHIIAPDATEAEWNSLYRNLPEGEARARQIIAAAAAQSRKREILAADFRQVVSTVREKDSSVAENNRTAAKEEAVKKYIRIEAQKLDHLINLVGELVINAATVKQLAERRDDSDLQEAASAMSRLIEELRDNVMNVRMVQIGETFRRFERTVRDFSRELGKEITLEIEGGDTELDKNLIENITDPLMHLVRNAVDHGIEMPAEREATGKPRQATIRLNAYHDTGSIVIEVSDDGRGLNREKILAKALEKGMAQPGHAYSDNEIFQFILEPGFSTADKVTNISGRGVGMDVVRKNIENMRGTVEMETKTGKGTTFRIRLPLTLAIIDGFLVSVGENFYVIPLDMVIECVELSEEELAGGGDFLNLRGEVLPFLRLREFFQENTEDDGKRSVIVVNYGRHKAGLVVDSLLGESQTVIKPLGRLFDKLAGISGATILGSGDVAMILDVPRLIEKAIAKQEASHVR